MIYCFRCFKMKSIDEFQDNRRHYQIKSRQGKVFSCNTCAKDWTVNNLMAVRYNFAENNWNIHRFSCEEEALKFLKAKVSKMPFDIGDVEIFSDSKYVILGITEWIENWMKKNLLRKLNRH